MRAWLLVALLGCSKKDAAPPPAPAPAPAPAVVAIDAAQAPDAAIAAAPHAAMGAALTAPAGKLADADHETIGGFALGAPSEDVIAKLGPPKRKSKEETMAATGETVSTWTFDGLEITMLKQDATYVINSIGVKPPSTAATSRGIHLGSTREEVEASYQRAKDGNGADATSLLVG